MPETRIKDDHRPKDLVENGFDLCACRNRALRFAQISALTEIVWTMIIQGTGQHKPEQLKLGTSVLVKVTKGQARETEKRFTSTFFVGRGKECDLQIADTCVSRHHLQVSFDGKIWRMKDLESANGTLVNGSRIQEAPLSDSAEVELGKGGPILSLTVEKPEPHKAEELLTETRGFSTETQIIQHYLDKSGSKPAGEQTMMFRRAFERAHAPAWLVEPGFVGSLLPAMGLRSHDSHTP